MRLRPLRRAPVHYWLAIPLCAGVLAGCTAPSSMAPGALQHASADASPRPALPPAPRTTQSPIQHIVIVVQENRSFDNLFQGYPGADTVSSGMNSKGQTIPLQPVGLEAPYGIDHNSSSFFAACNGTGVVPGTGCRNNGFDLEVAYGGSIPPNPQYGYVPHRETKPYFAMAANYVLADRMFTSHIDASFVSHQYIISGQAGHAVNLPTSLWGCAGGPSDTVTTLKPDRSIGPTEAPCFSYDTIGDELDKKGLPWRFYATAYPDIASIWSAYQAIDYVYGHRDWKRNVISPPAQFLTDVAGGTLGAVTWITPTFQDSDHAPTYHNTGPDWVASVVDAVGESPFWNTTAIVVMWDEWGGWYDHVPPRYVDYDGLGFRVPLLVISPYAKRGYISHVQYEHGSILKFVEDTFGLSRLAASDTRATSIAPDCFAFDRAPRPFVPIASNHPPSDFVDERPDSRPIDEE